MQLKRIRNLAVALALMAVVFYGGFTVGQREKGITVNGKSSDPYDLSLMWKVRDALKNRYLDKSKVDDKSMMYGSIEGMVSALDDPYTVFLPPKENKSSQDDLAGQFGGVGISLGYKDKQLAVMTTLPKTPAEAAGIKSGDLILKIIDKSKNIDKDTYDISLQEAVDTIRGPVGSEVTLKLFRDGGKDSFDVTLKRDNIVVASTELQWKQERGKNIAWVSLYKFSEQVYEDWPKIVSQIKAKEKEGNFGGIILDLRNNPGGYLQASVLVASDLLDNGVVVKQQNADGTTETYNVDSSRRNLTTEKMVVLVNGGSASAAEILAGAIKDHNRAKLIGEKTFGKGTVQQPQDFGDGSGLHITIAKWLLPSGKNIHKEGVNPDVEIKWSSDSKDTAQYKQVYDELLK